MELTFANLKPDCVQRKLTGKAIEFIEEHGFEIVRMRKTYLTRKQAEEFYAAHKGKPFFERLLEMMTSGPCIPMVLRKENAIEDFRKIIGNTDPTQAEEGTLRQLYGTNVTYNIVHGSDCEESVLREMTFFFPFIEVIH
ncbi:MAG: nucleoside-diphosphate kinase [Candidatus Marinimicrobia bacterium]|nr:nucleoside-diphosphate kinase [Candidatus Neomarinimicrobiota bacterium]